MSAEIDFEVDREVLDAYCFIGKAKQFFRLHENPRCRKSKRFHQEYRPLYLYGSYLGELYRDKKIVIALASEGAAEDGIIKILDIIKTSAPDFATFKIKTPNDEQDFKNYPLKKHSFNDFYIPVASIEILLNITKIKNNLGL